MDTSAALGVWCGQEIIPCVPALVCARGKALPWGQEPALSPAPPGGAFNLSTLVTSVKQEEFKTPSCFEKALFVRSAGQESPLKPFLWWSRGGGWGCSARVGRGESRAERLLQQDTAGCSS